MKAKKVARKGWNGAGLWAAKVNHNDYLCKYTDGRVGGNYDARPWYGLKDAQNRFGPWMPSTSDLMADDWEVVGGAGLVYSESISKPSTSCANVSLEAGASVPPAKAL